MFSLASIPEIHLIDITDEFGLRFYDRVEAVATNDQKKLLSAISPGESEGYRFLG
jgi:phosphoglucomutase